MENPSITRYVEWTLLGTKYFVNVRENLLYVLLKKDTGSEESLLD